MSSLRTWLRGSSVASSKKSSHEPSPAISASTSTSAISTAGEALPPPRTTPQPLSPVAREIADMEDAMASTALLLNDDIEGAEARLSLGPDSSAFHLMGLGVSTFMRSVLGFEKEFMAMASSRLTECESRAWDEMKKAQSAASSGDGGGGGGGWFGGSKSTAASTSTSATPKTSTTVAAEIYPAGSEFALVHAEAQIMLAVVAELHETLTEAVKGFYKLRKAFLSLSAIIESEEAYLRGDTGHAGRHRRGSKRMSFSDDPMPGAFSDTEFADLEAEAVAEEAAEMEAAVGADGPRETYPPIATQAANGHAPPPPVSLAEKAPSIRSSRTDHTNGTDRRRRDRRDLDRLTNPVDIFIHSGANMCFGLLLLIISMVPPAFSRLLSIVGFKGDRERGVRMLWQSTKFANINGGMAGLVLLAYYNGLIAYSDILPTDADIAALADPDEIVGYPRARCEALLVHMRVLYPDSLLWVLEEARLLATRRRVRDAIRVLSAGRVAKMRQITALTKFELAIDAMCALDWTLMRDAFLACVELNNWSHALYYYSVGCAEIELYRTALHATRALAADPARAAEQTTLDAEAAAHKRAAETHLRKAPTMAGKKKFMARQMPFDVFVIRKLARWEERAKLHGLDLADAVGVSPALEMAYLWNGSKRLSPDLLHDALTYLAWDRCTAPAPVVDRFRAAPDEAGIASLCRANLLRSLGRLDDAQDVLDKELLIHDRAVFKGPTKDDYILAAAHYEAAVVLWLRACDPACYPSSGEKGAEAAEIDAFRRKTVDESLALLDKVAKWETFVLDARIGMKLQTGLDTIRWFKKKKNWS